MNAVVPPVAVAAAIPFYKSPVFTGAVVSAFSILLAFSPALMTKLHMGTTDAISTMIGHVFDVIAFLASVFAAYKRKTSTLQPITLSQAAADVHPATLAAMAAVGPST